MNGGISQIASSVKSVTIAGTSYCSNAARYRAREDFVGCDEQAGVDRCGRNVAQQVGDARSALEVEDGHGAFDGREALQRGDQAEIDRMVVHQVRWNGFQPENLGTLGERSLRIIARRGEV
ncbi:hypothetical protein [Kribbella sp. C-35]|uniref:hypothetical protein n=1 Tax=Kribbella sp. C-35 TaxID=2789276 RepID=UPI00397E7651